MIGLHRRSVLLLLLAGCFVHDPTPGSTPQRRSRAGSRPRRSTRRAYAARGRRPWRTTDRFATGHVVLPRARSARLLRPGAVRRRVPCPRRDPSPRGAATCPGTRRRRCCRGRALRAHRAGEPAALPARARVQPLGRGAPRGRRVNARTLRSLARARRARYAYAAIETFGYGRLSHGDTPLDAWLPGDACPPRTWTCPRSASTSIAPGAPRSRWAGGVAPVVVFSGGAVHSRSSRRSSSTTSRRAALGVPSDRVLLDPCADHTHTNVRNAGRLVVALGARTSYIVTDDGFQSAYLQEWTLFNLIGGSIDQRSLRDWGYLLGSWRQASIGHRRGLLVHALSILGGRDATATFSCVRRQERLGFWSKLIGKTDRRGRPEPERPRRASPLRSRRAPPPDARHRARPPRAPSVLPGRPQRDEAVAILPPLAHHVGRGRARSRRSSRAAADRAAARAAPRRHGLRARRSRRAGAARSNPCRMQLGRGAAPPRRSRRPTRGDVAARARRSSSASSCAISITPARCERHRRHRAALGLRRAPARARRRAPSSPPSPTRRTSLLREVARGGAGAVYEAEDRELGRRVALKVYHEPTRDRDQLLHEVRAAVVPRGPGVVRIFDVDPEHGWIALEWAPPRRHARAPPRARRGLAPSRSSAGLAAARARPRARPRRRLVHLDVKPANVLLRAPDDPVLADFGIARRAGDASPAGQHGLREPRAPREAPGRLQGRRLRLRPHPRGRARSPRAAPRTHPWKALAARLHRPRRRATEDADALLALL